MEHDTYAEVLSKLANRVEVRMQSDMDFEDAFLRAIGDDGFFLVLKDAHECDSIVQQGPSQNVREEQVSALLTELPHSKFDDVKQAATAMLVLRRELSNKLD